MIVSRTGSRRSWTIGKIALLMGETAAYALGGGVLSLAALWATSLTAPSLAVLGTVLASSVREMALLLLMVLVTSLASLRAD